MTSRQVGTETGPAADQAVWAPELVAQERMPDLVAERNRARRRESLGTWAIRVVVFVALTGTWYWVSSRDIIDPLLISSPEAVAQAFVNQLADSTFWVDVMATFNGAMLGLLVGAVAGILTGVLFARVGILERAFAPFLTLANSLPRPALAPIFVLWFGLGLMPKVMVAASVVYFVLLTNTASALKTIDNDISMLTTSLRMSARQRFFKIELPSALPTIIGSLRLGAVYSVLGAVLAEMVGAYSGLGKRLTVLTNNFDVGQSFAVLLAMGLMSMLLDYAISGLQQLVRRGNR